MHLQAGAKMKWRIAAEKVIIATYMNLRNTAGLALAAIFVMAGCKTAPKGDPLIGRWQVRDVIREGSSIVGPGFHGSNYWFKNDGNVLAWDHKGDSLEVAYSRKGDTLYWVTLTETVFYMIDSLGDDVLRLSMHQDGIHSLVVMEKIKSEE
jgi:hypothetical protein